MKGSYLLRLLLAVIALVVAASALAFPTTADEVWVVGAVKRPGPVPYIPEMTLNQAINLADGFRNDANRGSILIRSRSRRDVARAELITGARPAAIAAGDIVYVNSFRDTPTYAVLGHLKSPAVGIADGRTPWEFVMRDRWNSDSDKKNLVLVRNLLNNPGKVRVEARQKFDDIKGQFVSPGDLLLVLPGVQTSFWNRLLSLLSSWNLAEILLQVFDSKISDLQRDMVRRAPPSTPEQRIAVMGEVNEPGSFPNVPGLAPAQYIALAGGPTRYANTTELIIIPALGPARRFSGEGEVARGVKGGINPGDTIVVQPVDTLAFLGVLGDVKEPFVKPSTEALSLRAAIAQAQPRRGNRVQAFVISGLLGNPFDTSVSRVDESQWDNPLKAGQLVLVTSLPQGDIFDFLNRLVGSVSNLQDRLTEWGMIQGRESALRGAGMTPRGGGFKP